MRRNLFMAMVLGILLGVATPAAAQVTTEAQFDAMRWPTRTMREILPERLAKLDASLHVKVADVTALKAIAAADRADGMVVLVKAGADSKPHAYAFHSTSTAAADNDLVAAPNAGTGRWFRLDQVDTADAIPVITSAVAGGFPVMTAGGALATSIVGPDSFATAAQGTKADAALPLEAGAAADEDTDDSITLNKRQVQLTTKALTTAAGSSYQLTWVSSYITATTPVICVQAGGTNTKMAQMVLVDPGAGSVVIEWANMETTDALDGTLTASCAAF